MTTTKQLKHMTQYQRISAGQKVIRLNNINKYYLENSDASINQAVKYTPPNGESAALVQQYSKLRTELGVVTAKDIEEYVYGLYPLRHRQRRGENGIRIETRTT